MTPSLDSQQAPASIAEGIQICEQALIAGEVFFGHGTDNAWDEAVQLVLAACGLAADSDASVANQPIGEQQWRCVQAWLKARIQDRVPLPYLTGRAWFAGLAFCCDERALVPRSPLAELILDDFQPWYAGAGPHTMLDLCCGGGSIGVAAAVHCPTLRVDLADIDERALSLAEENIALHDVGSRVSIIASDLFDSLPPRQYDLILSNPPYVDARDLVSMPPEYHREPPRGLGSGQDGLDLTRRILAQAQRYLSDTGLLVVEVGNSWAALETAYPQFPFTWIEFSRGGHGVFVMQARELQEFAASQLR